MTKTLEWHGPLAGALLPWAGAALGLLLAAGLATAGEDARDWPNWRGPFCNGTGVDCGEPLVENMAQAKVLWQSEQEIPNSLTYGQRAEDSGFCDPIVYQGRVYMQYFITTAACPTDERFLRMLKNRGAKAPASVLESNSKPQADDVVLCMDALSGKTLWKTVFPGKGVNMNHVCYPYNCYAPHMVICAADGRIVSFSASGRIYCVRATDGKPLWESTLGPSADRVVMRVEDYLRNHEFMGACYDGFGRGLNPTFDLTGEGLADFDSSGVIVDGVLVLPEYWSRTSGVRGYDMASGRVLWSAPNCSSDVAAFPVRWRHDGKDYVICAGSDTRVGDGSASRPRGFHKQRAVCFDPKTGRELWEFDVSTAGGHCCFSPSVSGDYLVLGGVQTYGGGSGMTVTGYRLTLEKAEKLWSAPEELRLGGFVGPLIYRDRVYFHGACADLKTGAILKKGAGGTPGIGADGRLFAGTSMMDAATMAPLGAMGGKDLGITYMCSSTYADGRLYFRNAHHVVCIDLHKTPAPAPTPAALKSALTDATATADLARLACGDDWPMQLAAAKLLTARGATAKSCSTDLVAAVSKAVAAGDSANAALLVPVIAAVDPPSVETMVAACAKSLESKDALVLVAACAALRAAGPKAAPLAKGLAHAFTAGDEPVTVAAADALAALGKDATAALEPLLAALAGKDEVKALQASRALMGMGAGAKDATQKIVDAFCAHPGPARFYLGEVLRAIGPASIPILIQKTSPYLPAASRAKGQPDKSDPALLRDTAKALKNFGPAAKDSTPYLRKAAAAMGTSQGSYKEFVDEAIEIVNGRPTKRVSVMGKHRFPCPLGPDDGSSKPDTTSKKGTDVDEP